jgi:microcystin degradation protein MlrC
MKYLALFVVPALLVSAQSHPPLIAVGGVMHETDTFNPSKTDLADFEIGLAEGAGILRDDQLIKAQENGSTIISGYIEGARRYGLKLYPTILAGPQTGGIVTTRAFNTLTGELIQRLKSAPKLDGVLLCLHGTMVAEGYLHADAEVVRRVREALGKSIPIVVTHDFHANVSPEIVQLSTALNTMKDCPHLDTKERGIQAAKIMADTVSGKVKPVQAIAKPPMVYNLIFQDTFHGPFKQFADESRRLEKNPKILAVSIPGGYQWADIPAMGPSVIVVTDNDPELAMREAQRLSDMLWASRSKLTLDLPDPATAVKLAMENGKFPVAILDSGDNVGGGSPGDSTFILKELLRQKAQGWVVTIADRQAAEAAFRAGVGQPFDMEVGGKTDKMHGEPVRVRGRVKSLHDGKFVEPETRHGGYRYWDMGLTAVIEEESSTPDLPSLLLLTMKRTMPNSLHSLISNGVYPQREKILVAKGTIAPLAAYEPIAARIIQVDVPGVTAVNPARFTYKNVRRPLWGVQ